MSFRRLRIIVRHRHVLTALVLQRPAAIIVDVRLNVLADIVNYDAFHVIHRRVMVISLF